MSLSALLERVEGATGETIDLFIAIACALDPVAYPGKWVEDEAAAIFLARFYHLARIAVEDA